MSVSSEELREAIQLATRYARSCDAGDVSAVLDCVTDEASLSFAGGKILLTGRTEAEAFFRQALITSTHLLSNYVVERIGNTLVVKCSAIAGLCSKEGQVTLKGLEYTFTCVGNGSDLRIQKLQHSQKWECASPKIG
jgi:hypothetical protein